MVRRLSTPYEDWRMLARNSQLLFKAMSEVWIETSRQQVYVVGNDGEILWKVDHQGRCSALLRMRPLSISWAERSVVISCGKVDYDKSG
jgi:hypothetical protein